jgi:hypothetical protein
MSFDEKKARAEQLELLQAENAKLKNELVHGQVLPWWRIVPSPENDEIYGPVSGDDPLVQELYHLIKDNGFNPACPILITTDHYIISGHRRYFVAKMRRLAEVPVKVHPISRTENPAEFKRLLVSMNSQRIKSTSDILHETIIKTDPKEALAQIKNQRLQKKLESGSNLTLIEPDDIGQRNTISAAKKPLLDAILQVLNGHRGYWPLSVRQIHYRLLNIKPLLHASKPGKYANDKNSYRACIDICARGRVAGLIPWSAIDDATRPVELNKAFWNSAEFFKSEFSNFLTGYWRNRQQSQPFHIEIVAEKLTVQAILAEVAKEYTMPLTISRGMNTLAPKKAIVDRYRRSKKQGLKLLVVTDLDPAGETIAEDLVKTLIRDFGLGEDEIEAFKVALTIDQVEAFELAPSMDAKDTSPTYGAFVEKHGEQLRELLDLDQDNPVPAFELEAMDPADLSEALSEAIVDVMDIDRYNEELEAEENDSAQIIAVQQQTREFFKNLKVTDLKDDEDDEEAEDGNADDDPDPDAPPGPSDINLDQMLEELRLSAATDSKPVHGQKSSQSEGGQDISES